ENIAIRPARDFLQVGGDTEQVRIHQASVVNVVNRVGIFPNHLIAARLHRYVDTERRSILIDAHLSHDLLSGVVYSEYVRNCGGPGRIHTQHNKGSKQDPSFHALSSSGLQIDIIEIAIVQEGTLRDLVL